MDLDDAIRVLTNLRKHWPGDTPVVMSPDDLTPDLDIELSGLVVHPWDPSKVNVLYFRPPSWERDPDGTTPDLR